MASAIEAMGMSLPYRYDFAFTGKLGFAHMRTMSFVASPLINGLFHVLASRLIHCLFRESSSIPAEDELKLDECRLAGKYLLELIKMDLKPRDIITPKSLRNAMVIVMALGGSTNAVLHLIAIAR